MSTAAVLLLSVARAQAQPASSSPAPAGPTAKLDGYLEMAYSYNLNRPSNGITNYRGFDNRHDTFSLSNAVLGATFDYESLSGRLAFQVGQTPSTYYLAEPALPGTSAVAATDGSLWKYVQQAYVGWKAPVGRGLLLQAGIFLSPVGYENMAIKDDWNWSRSDLFFGLPFYHTGIRATYEVTARLSTMVMLCNGWNGVVDNNDYKSIATQWLYKIPDRLTVSALYFGGPERPRGAPEGRPWRHLFDVWAELAATAWLSLAANADAGFEKNQLGLSSWEAGAVYARVQVARWLFVAAREDRFWEQVASNRLGTASPIFWPARWVGSTTLTVDLRPHPNLSFRVEYRHDEAGADMFFRGAVRESGTTRAFVPNASYQNTLTGGMVGWF